MFLIQRYHVEAKDNAKFLGSIEKNSHSIYLQDPDQMDASLQRLLSIIKMIYQVIFTLHNECHTDIDI